MKLLLTVLCFFMVMVISAQSPWVKKISYNQNSGYIYPDDTILQLFNVVPAASGNFYFEIANERGKSKVYYTRSDGTITDLGVYRTTIVDSLFLLPELNETVVCVLNHYFRTSGVFTVWIDKRDSVGTVLWTHYLPNYYDTSSGISQQYVRASDVLPGGTVILFCLDSTYYLDGNSGSTIFSLPIRGTKLKALPNGNLWVSYPGFTGVTDTLLNPIYPLYGTNIFVRDSLVFLLDGNVLHRIDPQNGNILSTVTIPTMGDFFDVTYEGGWITCVGKDIVKYDSTGTAMYTINVPGSHFGIRALALPDSLVFAGGTYLSGGGYFLVDYSAFTGIISANGENFLSTLTNFKTGDLNRNSRIDFEEVLYALVADGNSAPTDSWTNSNHFFQGCLAYDLTPDWSGSFPSGVNYKYFDLNFDNRIDSSDFLFARSCSYQGPGVTPTSCNTLHPSFYFVTDRDSFQVNDTIRFYMIAGSISIPIDSLFGLAILIEPPNGSLFNFQGLQNIGPLSSDFAINNNNWFQYNDDFMGRRLSVVMARKDHQNAYLLNGDTIFYADLIMDSLSQLGLTFLNFHDLVAMTANGTILDSISICTSTFYLSQNTTGIASRRNPSFSVSPNPTSGIIYLDQMNQGKKEIQIMNQYSKTVHSFMTHDTKTMIDLSYLSSGIYTVSVFSNDRRETARISIVH